MGKPHVLYRIEGKIAILTINRPEAKNAFSPEMLTLWRQFIEEAKADPNVRVIIVTGNGDTFCSGMDVGGRLRSRDMKKILGEGVHRIVYALEDLDKPIIAAINGLAMGAGLDIAIMCDLRVCSDRAKLLFDLVPGSGGTYFLPRLIGIGKALELLFTGDILSPQEALEIGLVNHVVRYDRLMEETILLAEKIANKPPFAMRMMKRAVYQPRGTTYSKNQKRREDFS
jgi:enoyl-CoA hydratase/carnithine racemase